MKLGKLVNAKEALNLLATAELDATKSYELVTFLTDINSHIENFEKTKNKRIVELGEEFEGGTRVKDENIAKFAEEMDKLLEVEIEVVPPELKLTDLGSTKIKPTLLATVMDWLIKKE